MLLFIVGLFLLCWGPRLIMQVMIKSGLETYSQGAYAAKVIFVLLSAIHSALNPFVYGFMSTNFRNMLWSCCRHRGSPSPGHSIGASTAHQHINPSVAQRLSAVPPSPAPPKESRQNQIKMINISALSQQPVEAINLPPPATVSSTTTTTTRGRRDTQECQL